MMDGKSYMYRYVYRGYGTATLPIDASNAAYLTNLVLGGKTMYFLFDDNYFNDMHWLMI
jgi:hypothetical protein